MTLQVLWVSEFVCTFSFFKIILLFCLLWCRCSPMWFQLQFTEQVKRQFMDSSTHGTARLLFYWLHSRAFLNIGINGLLEHPSSVKWFPVLFRLAMSLLHTRLLVLYGIQFCGITLIFKFCLGWGLLDYCPLSSVSLTCWKEIAPAMARSLENSCNTFSILTTSSQELDPPGLLFVAPEQVRHKGGLSSPSFLAKSKMAVILWS